MNRELQKYYEDRFAMMAMPGWEALIEDIQTMIDVTDSIGGISTEKELHFRKGELSIMNWINTLRESSAEVYEQLQEDTSSGS
jgi:hypothetical protein